MNITGYSLIAFALLALLAIELVNSSDNSTEIDSVKDGRTSHNHHHRHHHRNHTRSHRLGTDRLRLKFDLHHKQMDQWLNETNCGYDVKCLDSIIEEVARSHNSTRRAKHRQLKILKRLRTYQRRHRHGTSCSECLPGHYLFKECTTQDPVVCLPCPDGTYNEHNNNKQCRKCSLCGVSLYIAKKCTPAEDTVCDSCFTSRENYPTEYYQKCQSTNTTSV